MELQPHHDSRAKSHFRSAEGQSEGSAEALPEIAEAEIRGGSETILLAEDHEGLREMSHQALSNLGYSIVLARDGREAVEQFAANSDRISLLVLDVVMPRLGGPDALKQIRQMNPAIPVIFTSGYSEESDILSSLISRGAARLLQKPYAPRDLARKIRELLDKATPQQALQLKVGQREPR